MLKKGLTVLLSALLLTSTLAVPLTGVAEGAEPVDKTALLGDLNGDGKVNSNDARRALQAAVNKITLTGQESFAADVNKDAKVTASDAREILQAAVGKTAPSSYTVLDGLNCTVEVLFADYFEVSQMAASRWVRTVEEWQTFCDEVAVSGHTRYKALGEQKDRYDETFFEDHQLLLLTIPSTCAAPDSIRIDRLYDNGVYAQPDIRYTGTLQWPQSVVLAVTVDKELAVSEQALLPPVFDLSPVAVEGKPTLSFYSLAPVYWHPMAANGQIHKIVQVDTKEQLEALIADLEENIAPAKPDEDLMRYFELHDETYFETGSLVVVVYAATASTYRFSGLTQQQDGALQLNLSEQVLDTGGVGSPSPYAKIMALDISKKDLDRQTVVSVHVDDEPEIIPIPKASK